MLYMTFLDRTSLIRLILNSSQKRFPRRIKNECCVSQKQQQADIQASKYYRVIKNAFIPK